jgi:hypothetical protein
LIQAASELGAAKIRGKKLPVAAVERRQRTAITLNLGRNLVTGYHGPKWTRKQLALLGKMPDSQVARRIGRTEEAVRIMRTRRRIPTAIDRRRAGAK